MLEKLQRRSLPLVNNETILTYDYSNHHDGIVIATQSSISFYHLYEQQGNPHRVIFYDDIGPLSTLKLQNCHHPLIATIKNNSLSLWDMEKKLVPLVNHLQFDYQFNDFNWSYHDSNIFTTGHANGVISLWDLRTLQKPFFKFEVGTSYYKGIKWSPHSNNFLMTNVFEKNLTIFDLRMVKKNILSTINEKDITFKDENIYKILEFDLKIEDFTWSMKSPSFWTLTSNKKCELWKLSDLEPIQVENLGSPINIATTDWKITRIRPSYDDVSILHQNEKNGIFKILLTDKQLEYSLGKGKLSTNLGFNWRNPSFLPAAIQHSFLIVTSTGFVYTTDFTTEDFNSTEEAKSRALPPSEVTKSRRKNKLSVSNLKTVISDDPESYLNDHLNAGITGKPMTRSVVVGPLTFLSLIGEDLIVVNGARRDGSLDGVRIGSVDQFRRQVVLEFLIPASDSFSITSKNYSAYFTSYYKTDELVTFYRHGVPGRVLIVTISFPTKYSQFWNPKYAIENRSSVYFDPNLLSQLTEDLSQVAKAFAPKRVSKRSSLDTSNSGRNSLGVGGADSTDFFLYLIARCFRKKALRAWEKKHDKDKLNASLTSLKQSYETVASFYSESDQDPDGASAEFLNITEAGAFRVPLPVLSAGKNHINDLRFSSNQMMHIGIFNSRGELLLFGNAVAPTRSPADNDVAAKCEIVANIPKTVLISDSANMKGQIASRHRSYAHLMVARFKNRLNSKAADGKTVTAVSSSNTLDRSNHGPSGEGKRGETPIQKGDESNDGNDYDLNFIKEPKEDDNESNRSSHSASQIVSPTLDILGKLPSEIGALRDHKDSKDIFQNRRPSFHKDIPFRPTLDGLSDVNPVNIPVNRHQGSFVLCNVGFSRLLSLAEEYESSPVTKTPIAIVQGVKRKVNLCRHNATVAEKHFPNNRKLIQFWKLLAVALEVYSVEDIGSIINWNGSIIGCSLFVHLIEYLITSMDTQTWATVVSVLGDTSALLSLCATAIDSNRKLPIFEQYFGNSNERLALYLENQLYIYSQWLQAWGLPIKATEVIKHVTAEVLLVNDTSNRLDIPRINMDEMKLDIFCIYCQGKIEFQAINHNSLHQNSPREEKKTGLIGGRSEVNSPSRESERVLISSPLRCYTCKKYAIHCIVCTLPVRGLCSFCERCGHGGHEEHLRNWFNGKYADCPTGCGCKCRSAPDQLNEDADVDFVEPSVDDSDGVEENTIRNPSESESGTSYASNEKNIAVTLNASVHSTAKKRPSYTRETRQGQPNYLDELLNFDSEYNYNNFDV